jgi:hypothetical protein
MEAKCFKIKINWREIIMNKKLMITVLCISIGVVMLVTTAFASMSQATGYDTYKTAVENMMNVKSLTGNIQASLTDNGKELAKIDSKVKADSNSEKKISSSTEIKTGTQTDGFDLYLQNGKAIFKGENNDIYNVMESGKDNKFVNSESESRSPEAIKAGEMIVDALVGNLKNYFTTTEKADGVKQVKVQLSDSQIPTLVNALISLGVKNSDMKEAKIHNNILPFGQDLSVKLPKLTEDVRIDNINFTADISKENLIENQIIDLTIAGKDAEGTSHTIKLNLNIGLSDLNSTKPDSVDLTGKTVKTIDKAEFDHMSSNN